MYALLFSFLHGRMQPMRAFLSCCGKQGLIFVDATEAEGQNVSQGYFGEKLAMVRVRVGPN